MGSPVAGRLARVVLWGCAGPNQGHRGWVTADLSVRSFIQHKHGPSTFSELDPGDPEVNTRDTVPPSQIFTREYALSQSQRRSELPVLEGGSAWPHPQDSWPGLLFGALVTLVSGHRGTGSSLWWFSGTLDHSPKDLIFPNC